MKTTDLDSSVIKSSMQMLQLEDSGLYIYEKLHMF